MGFRRQDALIESRLQDRVDTPNDFTLLDWTSRRSNDKKPPDEPLRCDLHQILDETSIKTIKTIRRRLKAMDKAGIIRYSESARRYGYKCDIVIKDPDYINALMRIQSSTHARRNGRQVADTLVTGHDDHSQQVIDTLVTGHRDHSQKHQDTNAGPQIAGNGHSDLSNGHGDHSHSKKKEVKDLDGWMEDIDPSIQGLRAEEVTLNRHMLTHLDVGISQAKADEIAVDYDALTVFAHCCRYINDRQDGVRGPGALINRFDNPHKWPTPEITETAGSNFYCQFWPEVRNLGETDAADEPVTAHSNALSAPDTNDKAQIAPAPDDQQAQTPSEPGQLNFWNGNDNGSTNGADLWEKAKYEFELQMPPITYQQYVQATEIIDYTAGTFIIGAPNKSARDFLNSRLRKTIAYRQAISVLEKLTGQTVTLLFVDRSDPQNRSALAKRTTAAAGGCDDGQIGPAPNDSLQPEPEPNPFAEQLRSLLDQLDASEANAITQAVNREIDQIRSQALPADEERDHIDQLFNHYINTLENGHPRITASTRGSRPAPSCGDRDTDQITGDDQRDDAPSPEPATHMQDENIQYREVELNRHDHKPSTINFIPAQPGLQASAAQATRPH